jgi:hypothetical protein
MAWDESLGRWQAREVFGAPRPKYRIGRGDRLHGLSDRLYDRERKAFNHHGPYVPVIYEACQEHELSYEYRDGSSSYGAFTFSLAKALRETARRRQQPTFRELAERAASQLKNLKYDQNPNLDGPKHVLGQRVPWKA